MYRALIVMMGIALFLASPANAQETILPPGWKVQKSGVNDQMEAFVWVLGNECLSRKVCLMPDGHGTRWGTARLAALAMSREKGLQDKVIVINTQCVGECAIFATWARTHTCLGPKARVMLFRLRSMVESQFKDPPFPKDVDEWVQKETGADEKSIKAKESYPLVSAGNINKALLAMHFFTRCPLETLEKVGIQID